MKIGDLESEGPLLKLILSSLGEGVIVADRDGKIVHMNPMAMKISGQGIDPTPYDEWTVTYGIFHVDGVTPMTTDEIPLVRALRGEIFDDVELFMINPKIPQGVYISCTGRPLRDENGDVVGGVVVFRDITHEITSAHQFKERAGRVLFDLAKAGEVDREAALLRIAEADARMLGVERVSIWLFSPDRSEIVCETLYSLSGGVQEASTRLSALHYPHYFEALKKSRLISATDAREDPRTREFRDGYLDTLGIVSMMDVPIRLRGQLAGVVCHEHVGQIRRWTAEESDFAASIADLVSLALEAAERQRIERENENNLSLLRATLESTADGILVVDQEGKWVSYNRKFLEMWKIPEEILRSENDEKALAYVLNQVSQPVEFLSKVKDLYAHPDAESLDDLSFKDGRIFERYSKPQCLGEAIVGRVWSFRDVTAERRAYNEMKRINQFKTNLASMISHELRTPLAVIQESLGVVLDGLDGPVEAAQKKTLVIAKNGADWLGRLINNFLNFTRIEAGRMVLERKRMDARVLIDEACRLMMAFAERKGISLAKFTPEETVDVLWDTDQIKAAVINLIDNAVKYTEAPGYIWVRLKVLGDKVQIEVEDTGIGIRREDRSLIFDLFTQAADRAPWKTGGFGIGLTICKYVAERHGGRLELESQYGRGSLFRIELPKV